MNSFLIIVFSLSFFLAMVMAFFVISSCLGEEIRAVWRGRSTASMPTTYGLQYARSMSERGTNLEQIEMENMLDRRLLGDESD